MWLRLSVCNPQGLAALDFLSLPLFTGVRERRILRSSPDMRQVPTAGIMVMVERHPPDRPGGRKEALSRVRKDIYA